MLDKNKISLGIAPIAWTNDDLPDLGAENTFEQCISEMALAGYTGCEIGNKYPRDVPVLRKALELRGMRIANAWFSTFLTTKPFEEAEQGFRQHVTFLRDMGAKVVGVSEQGHSIQGTDLPIFEAKHVMDDREWNVLCTGLNQLGKISLEEYGITLTFHHHMGTVVQTAEEIRRMMAQTDPAYVNLLFDSGHLAYCGENPVEILREFAGRTKHVHLKDIRPEIIEEVRLQHMSFLQGVRAGTFTVPGDGSLDFAPIFEILEDSNYEGWMLVEAEQDPAKANPLEYAIKGRGYIRNTAGI